MIKVPKHLSLLVMSDSEYDSDSSVSSFEEPVKQTGGAKKSKAKKTSKKSTKATTNKSKKSSKKSSKTKKTSKKTTKKKSKSQDKSDKPKTKRKLNPIMARMNVLRNEHIGSHIGTKAPMKTIPPFKLVLAAARKDFKMKDGDKNTVEVVDKAIELFDANPSKYCQ